VNDEEANTVLAVKEKGLRSPWQRSQDELVQTLFDLNTEKKRLKTVLNCMTSGVMVTDETLKVVLHNLAFIRLMDIREELQTPVPVTQIIHDESLVNTLQKIQAGACGMDESLSQEVRTGTYRPRPWVRTETCFGGLRAPSPCLKTSQHSSSSIR